MLQSNLPGLRLRARGKVRDIYDVGETLLLVATDRVSTFDVVLPTPIPGKGEVLTRLSAFWFRTSRHIWQNHFLTDNVAEYPPELHRHAEQLRGRSMLCLKAEKFAYECVARGYLTGSIWNEYRSNGTAAGERLPSGMRENERLPWPMFTPATKAESGHDENISRAELAARIGTQQADELARATLTMYTYIADHAARRGIIVADTKLEFGRYRDQLIVIDELATPDSSRFWPADAWRPGHAVPSFDKQPLRDYLASTGWNKEPPAPELPPGVVSETSDRYTTIMHRLTDGDDAYH